MCRARFDGFLGSRFGREMRIPRCWGRSRGGRRSILGVRSFRGCLGLAGRDRYCLHEWSAVSVCTIRLNENQAKYRPLPPASFYSNVRQSDGAVSRRSASTSPCCCRAAVSPHSHASQNSRTTWRSGQSPPLPLLQGISHRIDRQKMADVLEALLPL